MHGVSPGTNILGTARDPDRAVRFQINCGLAIQPVCDPGCSGYPPTEDESIFSHGSDSWGSLMPTEFFGAGRKTLLQMPRCERQIKCFVNLSIVPEPELNWIDIQLYGQLVHCRFKSEKPR